MDHVHRALFRHRIMFWFPLMRTGRAFGQFPFVTKQIPEELLLHFVGVVVQALQVRW